jgi:hypothetical protein
VKVDHDLETVNVIVRDAVFYRLLTPHATGTGAEDLVHAPILALAFVRVVELALSFPPFPHRIPERRSLRAVLRLQFLGLPVLSFFYAIASTTIPR